MPQDPETCKECEHCEPYDGPEKPYEIGEDKAIMKCVSATRKTRLKKKRDTYCGIYAEFTSQCRNGDCDEFTPKKPKKPKEPEKAINYSWDQCRKCQHAGFPRPSYLMWSDNPNSMYCSYTKCHFSNGAHCIYGGGFTPKKKETKKPTCLECKYKRPPRADWSGFYCEKLRMSYPLGSTVTCFGFKPKKIKSTPNSKENKMWNKLRKRGRRITMTWDLFGVFLLCKLVNPWTYKLWHWILPDKFWDAVKLDVIYPWFFTILSIVAILVALYGLDRLAAWWYGEKK